MEHTYLAEFLVHDASTTLLSISQPAIAIRFLQFPTITIYGRFQGKLVFGKGKACKFKLDETTLMSALHKVPLYVMLVDAYPQNVKMLATASVDLSGFVENQIKSYTEFKRNVINLFDPVRNVIARLDLNISISKLEQPFKEQHSSEIFENITPDTIKKVDPALMVCKSVETDPVPPPIIEKPSISRGVNTEAETEKKEQQQSLFEGMYQPPPMFFSKSKQARVRIQQEAPQVEVIQSRREAVPTQSVKSDMLVDRLVEEIQTLRGASALQKQWANPPLMEFVNKKPAVQLKTQTTAQLSVPPKSAILRISTLNLEPVAASASEAYSEDFESISSPVMTASIEKLIKCSQCNEKLSARALQSHSRTCKYKKSPKYTPRSDESAESLPSRSLYKSISNASIPEEYLSDFEEVSVNSMASIRTESNI